MMDDLLNNNGDLEELVQLSRDDVGSGVGGEWEGSGRRVGG